MSTTDAQLIQAALDELEWDAAEQRFYARHVAYRDAWRAEHRQKLGLDKQPDTP